MSCKRQSPDLSRCLDGRLSATRRATLMAHVARCAGCARTWEELRAAQSLILALPPPSVDSGFRDRVWHRVRSGEGTEEILLHEPTSVAAKLRYGLIGGGAVAASIFGWWLVPGGVESRSRDLPPAELPPRVLANDALTALGSIASQAVDIVTGAAKRLSVLRPRLTDETPVDESTKRRVHAEVETIEQGLLVLDKLQHEKIVEFASSQACVSAARSTLRRFRDGSTRAYYLVGSLADCTLDSLREDFRLTLSIGHIRRPASLVFQMILDDRHFATTLQRLRIVQFHGGFLTVRGVDGGMRIAPGSQRLLAVPAPDGLPGATWIRVDARGRR